ncbi:hypothetical protein NDU88_002816 [Pleurodeles waltl]|uniref:Uncharacterized protein n=1 Tax=Pleurodeles waltl TaxID=8319 RepID=A0AAV7PGE4_PLEWA|nr:hypothetical protein NDU88_002816 [Pleurodeles waltl]
MQGSVRPTVSLCDLWHRHGPLRGLSQAAGLSFRPLAPGAGRRNWLLRRRFGLLLVATNGGYLSVTGCHKRGVSKAGRAARGSLFPPRRGHLSLHWGYVGLCGGHGTSSGLGARGSPALPQGMAAVCPQLLGSAVTSPPRLAFSPAAPQEGAGEASGGWGVVREGTEYPPAVVARSSPPVSYLGGRACGH